jgi:hypothetical protein
MVEFIVNGRAEDQYSNCPAHLWTGANQALGKANKIFAACFISRREETKGTFVKMRGTLLQNVQKRAKGHWIIEFPDFHRSQP